MCIRDSTAAAQCLPETLFCATSNTASVIVLARHSLGRRKRVVAEITPIGDTTPLQLRYAQCPCNLSLIHIYPGGISRRWTFPPTNWLLVGEGATGMVPTFTREPLDGVGAQLCPCNFATTTPQAFTVAS